MVTFSMFKKKIFSLGDWLENNKYTGLDVDIKNQPEELSTTLGFSCTGWINLYVTYHNSLYLERAKRCIKRILDTKNNDGLWLFPYKFRQNEPFFPYSCENFMTLEALINYIHTIADDYNIQEVILSNLNAMEKQIGFREDGCFWYSPNDKIEVPNISSMAANVFSQTYTISGDDSYLNKAKLFANYCVKNQREDGGYNYFGGIDDKRVSIPYHALEMWELISANRVIKSRELDISINKAVIFLGRNFRKNKYRSFDYGSVNSNILFKTPLWMSRAYFFYGDLKKSLVHFKNSLRVFCVPNSASFFYILKTTKKGLLTFSKPVLSSVFIRYNASCFEIGTMLIRSLNAKRLS